MNRCRQERRRTGYAKVARKQTRQIITFDSLMASNNSLNKVSGREASLAADNKHFNAGKRAAPK